MKNLGLPPTLVFKKTSTGGGGGGSATQTVNTHGEALDMVDEDGGGLGGNSLVNINRFAPNILGPEYEFDLVRGMNFVFDTGELKRDKGLAREFAEIKNRMCRYNISVTMRRSEYRQRTMQG